MSCDSAARQGIAAICAAHGADPQVEAQIQAVHDLPPTLRDGETLADLRREARIFQGRLMRERVDLPDHLDLTSDSSRTVIRWGRVNKALREAGIGVASGLPAHHQRAAPPVWDAGQGEFREGEGPGGAWPGSAPEELPGPPAPATPAPATAQRVRAVLKKDGHYSHKQASAGYKVEEVRGVLTIREDDRLGRRSPEHLAKAKRALERYQATLAKAGIQTELHTFADARPYLTVTPPQAKPPE